MELTHEFEVPVPLDEAWAVLTDIERVAPCMPGTTLDEVDGDRFTGKVKVKVGPISMTYGGEAGFTSKDEANRTAVIEAKGVDKRGGGTANATITATLAEKGTALTAVTVHTDLAITGKPAQFGRGVLADVGDKLLGSFADCLAETLASEPEDEPAPATSPGAGRAAGSHVSTARTLAPTDSPKRRQDRDDAIDLLDVAGGSVLRKLAPVIAAAVAILAVVWWRRR